MCNSYFILAWINYYFYLLFPTVTVLSDFMEWSYHYKWRFIIFQAPEVVEISTIPIGRKSGKNGRYDGKADLWSIGVITYECYHGEVPFKANHVEDIIRLHRNARHIQFVKSVIYAIAIIIIILFLKHEFLPCLARVFPNMKSVHIALNTTHSGCKPYLIFLWYQCVSQF